MYFNTLRVEYSRQHLVGTGLVAEHKSPGYGEHLLHTVMV